MKAITNATIETVIQEKIPSMTKMKEEILAQINNNPNNPCIQERVQAIEQATKINSQNLSNLQNIELHRDIQESKKQILIAKVPVSLTTSKSAKEVLQKLLTLFQVPNNIARKIQSAKIINAVNDEGPRIRVQCMSIEDAVAVRIALIRCKMVVDKGISSNAPWITRELMDTKPISIRNVIPRQMIKKYNYMEQQAHAIKKQHNTTTHKIIWWHERLLLTLKKGTSDRLYTVQDLPDRKNPFSLQEVTHQIHINRGTAKSIRNTHTAHQPSVEPKYAHHKHHFIDNSQQPRQQPTRRSSTARWKGNLRQQKTERSNKRRSQLIN